MARRNIKQEIRQALFNSQLALALDRVTSAFAAKRAEAYAGIDFKAVQSEVKAVKSHAIAILPELLARFKEEAAKAGATVHEAANANEAVRTIVEIARTRGAKRIVKAKSMATEEIGLNSALLQAGLEVVETDLGEWIVQLAGERPSHFVGPAVHKTREEVAALFSRVVGHEVPPDPEALVQVARKHLREAFISADIGISGANIAIADTGTLVIVTNEGNARLVTTLPPVHIAIVGIEKIVPDLSAATAILKYLPRSAAGQKITSYVSFITGPSRTADIEMTLTTGVHGPKEVHIVLLDNGRQQLRVEPELREALYCIKCGACLNVCPVFRVVGGHVFGHVYNGGIGAILTAFFDGVDKASDVARLCSLCGRCNAVCTAGIDIPRLIISLRHRIRASKRSPFLEDIAFKHLLQDQTRFRGALGLARKVQRFLSKDPRMIDDLPPFLSSLTSFRSLPKLAEVPFRDRWRFRSEQSSSNTLNGGHSAEAVTVSARLSGQRSGKEGLVAFFAGCVIDFVFPEIGEAVVRVLERNGFEVVFPPEQGCCGLPALYAGDIGTSRKLAKQTIEAIEKAEAQHVVSACPTCTIAIRKEFLRVLAGDEAWETRARKIGEIAYEFSEFLTRFSTKGFHLPRPLSGKRVTYHDPCHLRFGLEVANEPRQSILAAGYELIEMAEPDSCCGCAGTFSLKFPEISKAMLDRKLDAALATRADELITSCPACLLQLQGGLRKRSSELKVFHLAQLLDGQAV